VQGVFGRDSSAVVKIDAEDDSGPLSGTGFFVDSDGTIFTNYSVGGDSRDIFVSYAGGRYPASRVAADPRSGLAILKLGPPDLSSTDQTAAVPGSDVPQKTPFLTLGKASALSTASVVMTIGFPLNLPVTPSVGCVAGFAISYGDRYFAVSHVRATVPAQPGEGGAPLLNMDGEVVGIVESSLDDGAGCFALPIEAAQKVQSDVVRYGEARPGWMGIRVDKSLAAGSSIEVRSFAPGSPAEKAGIQPKDLILQVGDRKITSSDDALDAAFYLTAGEAVPVMVSRAGQTMEIKVVPGPSPLSPEQSTAFNLSFVSGSGAVLMKMLSR
jgi:serine protease Do